MKYALTLGVLLAVLPAAAGDLSGQVVITKRLTRKVLAPTAYDLRGPGTISNPPEPGTLNEFERTVVLLVADKPRVAPPEPVTVTIEQRNARFQPELVLIPVGSTVEFPNWDPIFHNVFSLSAAQPFDLGYYPKSKSRSVKFTRSGVVQVYCHIHANMYAAIVVTDTPWSGKPGPDGAFSFANVPGGHYRLLAWHRIAGLHHVDVDVPEHGTARLKIVLPVNVEPHP